MRAAVIGIGSNSVRLLVGDMCGGETKQVLRDREGTRLFAGLTEDGCLEEEAIRVTADAVRRMAETAREQKAETLQVFATSAARDAVNGSVFCRMTEEAAGVPVRILSGQEEAELSFLGATLAAGPGLDCGVVDIGGGSTEIAVGNGTGILASFSSQMGAVRLKRMIPIRCRGDMADVEKMAAQILEPCLEKTPLPFLPDCWIGTGGTFTSLSVLSRGVPWTDRRGVQGDLLTQETIRRIGEELADLSVAERLKSPSMQPGRADIVIHGICILLAVMNRLGLKHILVSETGNLDGWLRREYGAEKKEEA